MRGTLTIPKKRPNLTLPAVPVQISPETLVQRIPIDYDGDGTLEAFSNNDNVDVRVDGRMLELTGRKSGTAQITVRSTAGTNSKSTMGGGTYKSHSRTYRHRCWRITVWTSLLAQYEQATVKYQGGCQETNTRAS